MPTAPCTVPRPKEKIAMSSVIKALTYPKLSSKSDGNGWHNSNGDCAFPARRVVKMKTTSLLPIKMDEIEFSHSRRLY